LSFREIVDKATDAVVITEAENLEQPFGPKIVYVNDSFCKLSGYSKDEVIGKTPRILQGDETNKESLKNIKEALIKKNSIRETLLNFSKDKKPYWLDLSIFPIYAYGNKVTHFAAIERDVSQLKESELKNLKTSVTDYLTNLLNRRGFDFFVNKLFYNEKILTYSIISIDIDNFKKINDTYGHDVGDIVIKELANTIQNISREKDVCARFGGEEFVVFLPNVNSNKAIEVAERIRKKVNEIIVKIKEESLTFTISLGVASAIEKEKLLDTVNNADSALYNAKNNGKNIVKYYM
jgi:diguanylate cyclase (GGDEF)-like protein/PAS domain S-box-containing protein